jgi:hypothetical protein
VANQGSEPTPVASAEPADRAAFEDKATTTGVRASARGRPHGRGSGLALRCSYSTLILWVSRHCRGKLVDGRSRYRVGLLLRSGEPRPAGPGGRGFDGILIDHYASIVEIELSAMQREFANVDDVHVVDRRIGENLGASAP